MPNSNIPSKDQLTVTSIYRHIIDNTYQVSCCLGLLYVQDIDKLKSQKFFRLSLESKGTEQHDLEWCSLRTQTSLRTLILVGNIKIKPGDSFVSLSSLRTLHLDSVNIDAIAESLYQLKHLRYLSIQNCKTSKLPEDIGKLKFLQYISLSGCPGLAKLPSSIGVLQDLRFLRLHRKNVSVIPREFSGLTSLRKLYGFPAHMDCDHCSLEELGPLSQLTDLHICFLENVASSSSVILANLGGTRAAIKRVGLEFLQPSNHVGVAFPRLHDLIFGRFVEWEEWVWEETLVQYTIAHHHSKSNFSEQEVKKNVYKLIIKRLRTGT